LNSANTLNNTDYSGYNLSNEILFKHRFGTIGRTFSIDVITGANDKKTIGNLLTENSSYLNNTTTIDTLNQHINSPITGYNFSTNIAYTEPIHENGQIMLSYNANYNKSNADKRTYNLDSLNNNY